MLREVILLTPLVFNFAQVFHECDYVFMFTLLTAAFEKALPLLFATLAASADLKIITVYTPEETGSNSLWKMRHNNK